jgi:hypothetical protein
MQPRLRIVLLAAALLHLRTLMLPTLATDDFGIWLSSFTWAETLQNLWVPTNEHTWPLMRLTTYGLAQLAPANQFVPLMFLGFTHTLALLVVWLLHRYVWNETQDATASLMAAMLFGVSATYAEAIYWYAASPALAALVCGLIGLLGAQRNTRLGLLLAFLGPLTAPGWFAGGVLMGPLVAIYLAGKKRWWPMVVPLLGTATYLAISLPLTAKQILHADHYQGRTALQAFDPLMGLWNTIRSLADHTFLAQFGIWNVAMPEWLAVPVAIGVIVGLVWWWKRAPRRTLVVMGAVLLLLNNLLIFGARAGWSYSDLLVGWSRYQAYPQFGLALILAGGWRSWQFNKKIFLFVLVAMFLLQLPRAILGCYPWNSQQLPCLNQLDIAHRKCIQLGITRDDLIRAMPAEPVPNSADHNRWRFVSGSSTATLTDPEAIRQAVSPR